VKRRRDNLLYPPAYRRSPESILA